MPNQFRRAIISREFTRARVEALSSYLFDDFAPLKTEHRMRKYLTNPRV